MTFLAGVGDGASNDITEKTREGTQGNELLQDDSIAYKSGFYVGKAAEVLSPQKAWKAYQALKARRLAAARKAAAARGKVQVRGYTRKDGTKVPPHERSKPQRKKK